MVIEGIEGEGRYWLSTSHWPHEDYYLDTIEQVVGRASDYFKRVRPYGLLLFEKKESKKRKRGYKYVAITGFTKETIGYIESLKDK